MDNKKVHKNIKNRFGAGAIWHRYNGEEIIEKVIEMEWSKTTVRMTSGQVFSKIFLSKYYICIADDRVLYEDFNNFIYKLKTKVNDKRKKFPTKCNIISWNNKIGILMSVDDVDLIIKMYDKMNTQHP